MATRVTRSSQRFAKPVEVPSALPVKTTSTKIEKRQRKHSESSAKSDVESAVPENDQNNKTNVHITPPKQGKFEANRSHEQHSPSTLLTRLSLEHHDEITKPKKKNTIDGARKILNVGEMDQLYGRETELADLSEFLESNMKNKTSASMYISGQPGELKNQISRNVDFRNNNNSYPGTGKTASVQKLLRSKSLSSKFTKVYINCTTLQTPSVIYKAICNELCIQTVADKETNLASIHNYICGQRKKMLLLVLDEIDELIEKKQSVLYTIFEWPTLPKSKIILIGIANSLDLTNRALSRLQLQSIEMKPKLVHFKPYTKQQIVDIFKNRLEEAGALDVFPMATIQLLSAKVAAMSGDVRKALDIGRRVAEIAKHSANVDDIDFDDELGVAKLNAPSKSSKVEIKQVLNVLNGVYNTANTLDDHAADAFPLQQKILVCTLLVLLKTTKNKDITVSRLHSAYAKVCNKRGISAVDASEFMGICSLTETKGIIKMIKNKVLRLTKIQLQWDEDEITRAIKDKQLIANILTDKSILDTPR